MSGDVAPRSPIARKPPGRVGRWFARAPRYLYKARLGRLLGRRFVHFELGASTHEPVERLTPG